MCHIRTVLSACLLLCALTTASASTSTTAPRKMPRLRAATPHAARVIEAALRDSPTVQRLAHAIAESDLIVYIEIGDAGRGSRASTELVAATEHDRFLRVTIDRTVSPHDHTPLIAHELQHAVELAEDRSVRDSAGVRALYARIGTDPAAHHTFETMHARLTERQARREVRQRPR